MRPPSPIRRQPILPQVRRYAIVVGITWLIAVSLSLIWNLRQLDRATVHDTYARVADSIERSMRSTRWDLKHTTIPITVLRRDFQGRELLLEESSAPPSDLVVRGHLVSLEPSRTSNATDAWERAALKKLQSHAVEVSGIVEIDGKPHLRVMRQLRMERSCLACHSAREARVGSGISVSIPVEILTQLQRRRTMLLSSSHAFLALVGLIISAVGYRSLRRSETVRLQAERIRDLNERRFRAVLDHTFQFIGVMSPDGILIDANQTALEFSGTSKEEVVGKPFWEGPWWRHSPELQDRLRAAVRRAAAGEFIRFEATHTARDGSLHSVDFSLQPVKDETGEVVFLVPEGRDITEHKRQEEEAAEIKSRLQHAQRLESLGVVAGGVAHDFNNLLTTVMGNAGMILMDLPPESPIHGPLIEIRKAANQAARLTAQLLAYAGKAPAAKSPADLNRLIADMENLLAMASRDRADIRYDLAPELPSVLADRSQVEQVVMNLILNATEASDPPQRGLVEVKTGVVQADRGLLAKAMVGADAEAGPHILLEVSDTGCGMDQSTLSRIFEPFFSTKFAGRGLGLPSVMGIVRNHNGAILVESAPGRGSRFRVLLPCCAQTPEPSAPAQAAGAPAVSDADATVLIIEDEEAVRRTAEAILKKAAFPVLTAEDGRSGLRLFEENQGRVSLVLLDMVTPGMNCLDILTALREMEPRIPVLLTSGYSEAHIQTQLPRDMSDGFLQKPFEYDDLVETVRSLLASRRNRPAPPP